MAKVRVYELAKEFGVESKAVMAKLQEMGEFVRSASSTIEAPVVRRLTEAFAAQSPAAQSIAAQQASQAKEPAREARRAQRPQVAPASGGRPDSQPDGQRRAAPRSAAQGQLATPAADQAVSVAGEPAGAQPVTPRAPGVPVGSADGPDAQTPGGGPGCSAGPPGG